MDDEALRSGIDRYISSMVVRHQEDDRTIEELNQEIKRLNREVMSMKRTLLFLKEEREQMRSLLRSLETRLLSLPGKSHESDASQKT